MIVKTYFGSLLYGTATLESDTDIKGIFLPSKEQVLLGAIPKNVSYTTKMDVAAKNTREDVDVEIYSLHYFIDLACAGETVALDMLHAPQKMIILDSPIWREIVANREKFYTKNLKAFIVYARRQAAKYGIKGSRLNDARGVITFLSQFDPELALRAVWEELPILEHVRKRGVSPYSGLLEYEVCGKVFQETAKVGYVIPVIEKFIAKYGARAELAARNEGIDWKALSHALRAGFEVKEILTQSTITFPLKEADYLIAVKQGKLDYLKEVAPKLDSLVEEVEELSSKSTLPQKVDRAFWNGFIMDLLERELFCGSGSERITP